MRIPGTSHTLLHSYTQTPIHSQTHTPTTPPNFFLFASGASAGRRVPVRFGAPFSLDINKSSFLPSTGAQRSNRAPILDKYDGTSKKPEAAGGIDKPLSPGETSCPLPPRTKQAGASFVTNPISNSHLDSTPNDVDVSSEGVGAPAPAFESHRDDWDGHSMNLAGWIAMAGLYAMDVAGMVWGLFKRKKCKKS